MSNTPQQHPPPIVAHGVGDFSPLEFRAAAGLLRELSDVVFDATVPAACERIEHQRRWPEIVVLAEHRPGELSHRDLDRLQGIAPLARPIGLLGPWCEGEARSGFPWPGMIRTYWHQWTGRWAADLMETAGDRPRLWTGPTSATAEDRLLRHLTDRPSARPGLVAIDCELLDTADLLVDACRHAGYAAYWLERDSGRPVGGLSLVIWEGRAGDLERFAELQRRFAGIPRVAVLDFPRWETVQRFTSSGAAAVVSRPFLLDEFCQALGTARRFGTPASVA